MRVGRNSQEWKWDPFLWAAEWGGPRQPIHLLKQILGLSPCFGEEECKRIEPGDSPSKPEDDGEIRGGEEEEEGGAPSEQEEEEKGGEGATEKGRGGGGWSIKGGDG